MMKKITLLFFVLIALPVMSQNYQTVDDLDNACAQLGFMSDEDAQIAVDDILGQLGLFRNFTIQECPNINNAVAKNIEVAPGHKERYILYDSEFFGRIAGNASNDWAATSILAHEIGHHLNGHSLNNKGSNHKWELEADEFSGFVLAKMGASLEDAQSALATLKYEKETRTHPAKADRMLAVKMGWDKASEGTAISEKSAEEQAADLIVQGLEANQQFDYTLANELYDQAKDLGDADAYYYLSQSYYVGDGVEINYNKAYQLAKEGYDMGSVPATYQMAKYMSNGIGVKKDTVSAQRLFGKDFQLKWFEEQFQKTNSGFHAYTIGYIYHQGYAGAEKDLEKAVYWYQTAEKLGNPMAINNLGAMYDRGDYFNEDMPKAIEYYTRGAEIGLSVSERALAGVYLFKEGYQDEVKALKWLKKSAVKGDRWSQALLGDFYRDGRGGLAQDFKKALYWNKKSAAQGDPYAYFDLGNFHFYGQGTEVDKNKALEYFELAAEGGLISAYVPAGIIHLEEGTALTNHKKALEYFNLAAATGDPNAEYYIGVVYLYGMGVFKDPDLAISWFNKSVAQNNPAAQSMMGQLYYTGYGSLKKNKKKGLELMQLAARGGDANAQTKLTQLGKKW